jgi:hypothetical protein
LELEGPGGLVVTAAAEWVDRFLGALDRTSDIDRVVAESSGLDARGILDVLEDGRLGPHGIQAMSDLMRPTGSMYYDAIYGAFHGQVAIRNWLVPTMAEIDFVEFVPLQPTAVFDAGGAESSVDEWQMFAVFGDDRIPLPRGVSTRHYADGWIVWNADVYDTGPFRMPPPEGTDAAPLPDPPTIAWQTTPPSTPTLSDAAVAWLADRPVPGDLPCGLSHADMHAIVHHPVHGADVDVVTSLMHPDATYLDPLFGDFNGREAIRSWLADVMAKIGAVRFDEVGPCLFNGSCSVQEWVQVAVGADGTTHPMMRGTSVRRYADGWITYCADYFDTAVLTDAAVVTAASIAGSTLGPADIARYRS